MAKVAAFKRPPDPIAAPDRIYTFREAMDYLRLSRNTLRNHVTLREIECIRYKQNINFTQSALDRFVAKHTIAARD